MISGDELSKAMAKFATGVTLITTSEEDGSVHAMTANAITSISLEPALVLVCVAHTRNTFRYIRQSGRYAINVLNAEQLELARHFARSDRDREFQKVPVDYGFSRRGTPSPPFLRAPSLGLRVRAGSNVVSRFRRTLDKSA